MQIELNKVCKDIKGKRILDNISLTLNSGNIYGFTGDNGCGKTVLFKTILGLMKKSSGNIFVDGALLTDLLQNVGFVIERPEYIPYYSAFKNLEILASYHKLVGESEIKNTLITVGLDPEDKKKVGMYSLGMKQKLALAMAFFENPDVLILDEPLNALDRHSVVSIRQKILDEKNNGKLILIASHYKEDIEALCDVILCMEDGKIIGG